MQLSNVEDNLKIVIEFIGDKLGPEDIRNSIDKKRYIAFLRFGLVFSQNLFISSASEFRKFLEAMGSIIDGDITLYNLNNIDKEEDVKTEKGNSERNIKEFKLDDTDLWR